jgi:hypothetical protein
MKSQTEGLLPQHEQSGVADYKHLSVRDRVAWRFWRRHRVWSEFRDRLTAQTRLLESVSPWCHHIRAEQRKLFDRIEMLFRELDGSPVTAELAFDSTTSLGNHIDRIEGDARELLETNRVWTTEDAAIHGELDALKERASLISGRTFAARTKELSATLGKHPDQTRKARIVRAKDWKKASRQNETMTEYFRDTKARLVCLRNHVETAEQAISGFAQLKVTIFAIDQLSPQQDVPTQLEYSRILATRAVIESELFSGSYSSAHHHLEGARRLCSKLHHALENRFALVRAEIDLWLDDGVVAQKFALHQFPRVLSATDSQHWQDLRIEIAAVVSARAERARKGHAMLFRTKRNIQVSMEDLRSWERLAAFAKSTMNASKP